MVSKQNRVNDGDFHRLWKLCGKCVFVHVCPYFSGETLE
jgi:hypothetical protein